MSAGPELEAAWRDFLAARRRLIEAGRAEAARRGLPAGDLGEVWRLVLAHCAAERPAGEQAVYLTAGLKELADLWLETKVEPAGPVQR